MWFGCWKGELAHLFLKPMKPKLLPVGLPIHPMVAFTTPPPSLLDHKLNHLSSKLLALFMQKESQHQQLGTYILQHTHLFQTQGFHQLSGWSLHTRSMQRCTVPSPPDTASTMPLLPSLHMHLTHLFPIDAQWLQDTFTHSHSPHQPAWSDQGFLTSKFLDLSA